MRNRLAEEVLDKDTLYLMKQYRQVLGELGSSLGGCLELLQHTSSLIDIFRDIRTVHSTSDLRLTGLEFGSAAQLSKRPGSVLNCLWGNALKRSPGIIRKSRVLYPGPGFLSSATWPSLPKKHYNGLNK